MDRYESQGGTLWTAPGLWPGIIGLVLGASRPRCSCAHGGEPRPSAGIRRKRTTRRSCRRPASSPPPRFFLYGIGLVGRGLPFWLGTAVFVATSYVYAFDDGPAGRSRSRRLAVALRSGAATALVVTLVFERVFLVRAALDMFEGLFQFGHAIAGFLDPLSIGLILLSSLVGFIIGALPGLTATMGVALMTTLTIKLPSSEALLVLICTYVGAIYGGSRSAILLNIPGTPASAASCLDGHALAKQGLAGRAMGIATSGSILGTLIGMVFLALFTPILGDLALKFGAYEFFWLAVFGVIISGKLTGDDPLKGWMAGFLGICSSPGSARKRSIAFDRFTFGTATLPAASRLVPALVGAFGFAECSSA